MSSNSRAITSHPTLKSDPWPARWLWLASDRYPAAQTAPISWWSADAHQAGRLGVAGLLRGTFLFTAVPNRVFLRVSADSRYRLWINDRWVGRGPAMVGGSYAKIDAPNWWYYDMIEVTPFLRAGANVVAAEVITGPDNQTHFSLGQAGFAAEWFDEQGMAIAGCWRGIAFTGYRIGQWSGFTRECDLGQYPVGWRTVAFDDQAWPELVEIAPRPALLAHDLPPLAETRVQPVDSDVLTLESGETVQVKFEHLLAGHLQFTARAAATTAVHVVFEEMPGGTEPETRQLKLTLPAGETVYESAAYFSARSLRMTASGPLELRGVGMLSRSQPVQDRGAFECSDPFLNDLWRGMLAENPHGLHEMWTQGDWSHAWSGTPLVQLSRRVLGVEALEPGWRRVRLKPCPLDIAWARGVVPTPQGEVRIEWERREDTVQVQVQAPDGIEIITEGGRQGPDVSQQTGVLTCTISFTLPTPASPGM